MIKTLSDFDPLRIENLTNEKARQLQHEELCIAVTIALGSDMFMDGDKFVTAYKGSEIYRESSFDPEYIVEYTDLDSVTDTSIAIEELSLALDRMQSDGLVPSGKLSISISASVDGEYHVGVCADGEKHVSRGELASATDDAVGYSTAIYRALLVALIALYQYEQRQMTPEQAQSAYDTCASAMQIASVGATELSGLCIDNGETLVVGTTGAGGTE